jgi:tetratricopeptide (TPR) repeat protein
VATTDEALALAAQYRERGALQPAEQLCRQVLQVEPQHPEAIYHLGMIAYQIGKAKVAEQYLGQAATLQPANPTYHCHLGMAYRAQGRFADAIACYEKALDLKPDYAEAHNNLGNAYRGQGRLPESIACYEQAVRFQPEFAGTHNNLSVAYQAAGRYEEAVRCGQEALRLQPGFVVAYINLGAALDALGKPEEALESYRQAIALQPRFAEAYYNMAAVLQAMAKPEEALACFDKALLLQPNYAPAHLARASGRLLTGNFKEGWPEYEWRRRIPQFAVPPLPTPQPAWDGSSLVDRRILVRAEQGTGDTMQFVRYAPLLKKLGGHVIVEAQTHLISLLRTCPGIDHLVGRGEPLPEFDVHTWLLSLPGLLGTDLSNLPADVPYLWADSVLVDSWRKELSAFAGYKVGILWQGNPGHRMDHLRSVPLTAFAPLAQVEGVHLFSLQKQYGTEQLAALGDRFRVTDLGGRFDASSFADAAAAIMNLDLVVTVDTAVAHLAGALGAPAWVLLPISPDWRWLLQREDSPWYPTMRLFRQDRPRDWPSVIQRVAVEIRRRAMGQPCSR